MKQRTPYTKQEDASPLALTDRLTDPNLVVFLATVALLREFRVLRRQIVPCGANTMHSTFDNDQTPVPLINDRVLDRT